MKERNMESISKILDLTSLRREMSNRLGLNLEPKDTKEAITLLEQSFVAKQNEVEGSLKYLDCPECKNRGFLYFFDESRVKAVCVPCECMTKRKQYERISKSGLSEAITYQTLETFKAEEAWQVQMLEMAKRYIDEPNGWFYIGGQVGCGKTHICTAIAGELMNRGEVVRYMRWKDESTKIKSVIMEDDKYSELVGELKQAPFLYIDDFFKTKKDVLAGDINLAFEILNYRYSEDLPTIISSEKDIDDLLEIDEAIGSRIYEKSKDYSKNITQDDSRNFRTKKLRVELNVKRPVRQEVYRKDIHG